MTFTVPGSQTRDFTYVANVVEANVLAAGAPAELASGTVVNIGGGQRTSLLKKTFLAAPDQNDLFDVGAELATPPADRWEGMHLAGDPEVTRIEEWIDALNEDHRQAKQGNLKITWRGLQHHEA